jgi:hypothetical protein
MRSAFGGTNPNSSIKSTGGDRAAYEAPPFSQNLQNELIRFF